jgi:prevent-host-death family protein
MRTVSKSKLKAKALEYFRQVEKTGSEILVTDRGRPVLKIVPYREKTEEARRALKGSVLKYDDPTAPVGVEDWESLR